MDYPFQFQESDMIRPSSPPRLTPSRPNTPRTPPPPPPKPGDPKLKKEGGKKQQNKTVMYKNKKYTIHIGKRGGKYILVNNEKIYV